MLYLNKLNTELIDLKEDKFHSAYLDTRHKLEKKYFDIYRKTSDIALSKIPCEISDEDYEKYNIDKEKITEDKPIEDFWLTIFENAKYFPINQKDREILKNLIDVRMVSVDNKVNFKIEFEFKENEFFEGTILSKTYEFDEKTEKLIKSTAQKVAWKEGKDPGIKVIVKKIKKKKSVQTQTTTKVVKTFFDIFDESKFVTSKQDSESRLFKCDLLPNILEYYMNIFLTDFSECFCDDHKCDHKHSHD